MQPKKIGQSILVSVLALLPFALFAAVDKYENPLGCDIATISQFVKAILTIIVKIGIPVATIFIIWSGFLFLTAQGDEAQLTKAKKAFIWSCIGTAVLLGAWLLGVAINATIQSIGGVTNSDTTVNSECDTETVLRAVPPVVAWVLDGELTNKAGSAGSMVDCPVSDPYTPTDAMKDNGLVSTDTELFSKSKTIVHNDALLKETEQAYLFLDFGDADGWLFRTGSGNGTSVDLMDSKVLESFIDTTLPDTSRVTFMHSHPSAYGKGKVPPSLPDLMGAYVMKVTTLGGGNIPLRHMVADSDGIWEFSIPAGSAFAQAADTITQKTQEFLDLPDIKAQVSVSRCDSGSLIRQLETDALNGKYGAEAQSIIEALLAGADTLTPFYTQDTKLDAGGLTNAERLSILQEREALEQSLGVSLQYTPM